MVVTTADTQVESSEAGLIERARRGDADAFCDAARPYEARLFRQAHALCRRPGLAEELVVETLVEAWRSIARFDGSCRLSTWLYAILVHRFQKAIQRTPWRPLRASDLTRAEDAAGQETLGGLRDPGPWPPEALGNAERSVRFLDAIGTLPHKHQQVLLLRFYEGASLGEIASALGVSVGTVKSRLHHGLTKLRYCPAVVNLLQEWRES